MFYLFKIYRFYTSLLVLRFYFLSNFLLEADFLMIFKNKRMVEIRKNFPISWLEWPPSVISRVPVHKTHFFFSRGDSSWSKTVFGNYLWNFQVDHVTTSGSKKFRFLFFRTPFSTNSRLRPQIKRHGRNQLEKNYSFQF